MIGTLAARAEFAELGRRVRTVVFVLVVAACCQHAGNACVAAGPAVDGNPAIGRETGGDEPLLVADSRLTSAGHDQTARGFRSILSGLFGDRTQATIAAPERAAVVQQTVLDDSLKVQLPPNDFVDNGPGAVKYAMSGLDVDSLRSVAGARMQLITAAEDRSRALAEARMAWLFEYLQNEAGASSFSAPGDKGIFAVQGLSYGSNWLLLGGGLRWELSERLSAHAGYDAQVNSQQMFHIGSGTVRYVW